MLIFSKKQRGFTLIESMVAIAIIGIMSAVAFVSLTSNRSASRLKTAQREVTSVIKLAQTYALQGNRQGGVTPCGYGFRFDPADANRQAYEIFYNLPDSPGLDCEDKNIDSGFRHFRGTAYPSGRSEIAETFSLKNSVILGTDIYPPPGNMPNISEIYFTVPHASAHDDMGNEFVSPQTRVLTLDLSGVQKTVTFSAGGSVNESP